MLYDDYSGALLAQEIVKKERLETLNLIDFIK